MALFKKQNEMEKLQGQKEKLAQKVSEVEAKLTQVQNAKVFADTDLMLEDSLANKKKVEKYAKAIEGFQAELQKLNGELAEIDGKLGELFSEEKQQEINDAGKAHEEEVYTAIKRRLFEMELDRFNSFLYSKSAIIEPVELKKLAGLRHGEHFDSLEHGALIEARNIASDVAAKRAKKEFDELMAKINEFLEK
ncbi:hypothetical protein V7152_23495 [Neobacillus drentensis]|uniref:hypothetical protein n=1 Tax=Neobacillus drentensis TaxID=220684 RepID=UPI0030000711